EKARIKSIILGVRGKVLEGHTLAAGLDDFPHAFPQVYRATVAAGEQAGRLDAVLERLADYTESRHSLRQKLSHALVYPIVLTALSLGIILMMLVYVVPRVVSVFESTSQELPALTRYLIVTSDFMQAWWFAVLGVIVLAALGARRLLKIENVRRSF